MNAALLLAALALGVTASPHCALMCGAPCASLTSGCGRSAAGFHLGRMAGYALAGALAAGSMAALASASRAAPALRPLWGLLQLSFFALGLWWLATGRQAAWLRRQGSTPLRFLPPGRRSLRAGIAGLGWVVLPCGVLQAALLLAALSNDAAAGALVMLLFALGSLPALALAPWLWARWQRWSGIGVPTAAARQALGLRLAGLGLVLMSGWALTQGLWLRVAAWCVGA